MIEILLIEDDPDIADNLQEYLSNTSGGEWRIHISDNGDDGLELATQTLYSLILLDIGLPERDGFEICRLLRRRGIQTPVIFVTARYSEEDGKKATDETNNIKLLKEMENVKNREARFVCALCFINSKGEIFNILETVEGKIAASPKGENGFGYDPLFIYNNKSFAQIAANLKNEISHRGKAISKLLKNIENWI